MRNQEQSDHKDPLMAWLVRQLETVVDGIRPDVVTLSHLDVSERSSGMERFVIESHTGEAAADFASNFRFLARQDAEHREGMQRYAVHVYWPRDSGSSGPGYTMFSVDGSQVRNETLTMATEPANSEGALKMVMRHLELYVRLDTASRVSVASDTAQREDRLLSRITELEEGRMTILELTEKLVSSEAERAMALRGEERKQVRLDEAFEEVKGVVGLIKPRLLAKIAGKGGLAEDGASAMAAFRFLFEGMTIEQMKVVQGTLDPQRQAAFVELYKDVMGTQDKKTKDGGEPTDGAATDEATTH